MGRHPVIESQLSHGNPYIPNDINLCEKKNQILMITGPNMSGKSAIIRQKLELLIKFLQGLEPAIIFLQGNQLLWLK